jgi:hypothetical protein
MFPIWEQSNWIGLRGHSKAAAAKTSLEPDGCR